MAFFIDTQTGQVATRNQLLDAGLAPEDGPPPPPWHPLQGPSDGSTMWYAVLRKRARGQVWIGSLVFRHSPRHASLLKQGWAEVRLEEIGAPTGTGRPGGQAM